MNPIQELIDRAIAHEVSSNRNPFITYGTIVCRLIAEISKVTHVIPVVNEKTILFRDWHELIFEAYTHSKSNLPPYDRTVIERVLSKDSPPTNELLQFACCWFKMDAKAACRLFAVDGWLGTHPKFYVQEAFCPRYLKHNNAVRALYAYCSSPDRIKAIVGKALELEDPMEQDADFKRCVELYSGMMEDEELTEMAHDRKCKLEQKSKTKSKKMKSPEEKPAVNLLNAVNLSANKKDCNLIECCKLACE